MGGMIPATETYMHTRTHAHTPTRTHHFVYVWVVLGVGASTLRDHTRCKVTECRVLQIVLGHWVIYVQRTPCIWYLQYNIIAPLPYFPDVCWLCSKYDNTWICTVSLNLEMYSCPSPWHQPVILFVVLILLTTMFSTGRLYRDRQKPANRTWYPILSTDS